MIRAGFLIDALGASQQSIALTSQMNELMAQKANYSMCLFYRNYDRSLISPHFAMFSEYVAWSFSGIAIATDIKSAKTLLKCPGPKKKFFYVWSTEWAFNNRLSYSDLAKVYQADDMQLIVRSESHYDIVSKLWQRPAKIIEEFNYEQVADFLTEESQGL